MNERAILRERLSKVEALLARPGHEGERLAAQAAVERIGERLAQLRRDDASDLLFPQSDFWAHDLQSIIEIQRVGARSLLKGNLALARGATSFIRAALGPQTEAIARFWSVGQPWK